MEDKLHQLVIQKGNPYHLINHKPIALASTIYKLFTSTIMSILVIYGKQHQILHNSQGGFRVEWYTSQQLQTLISTLGDNRFTTQDICILYVEFKNVVGSIDHARLLAVMGDLGYPHDTVALVGNILILYYYIYSTKLLAKWNPFWYKEEPYKETHWVHTYSLYS